MKNEEKNGTQQQQEENKDFIHGITLLDTDFDELLQLKKEHSQLELQLDRVSGAVFRLKKDQEILFEMEKAKTLQLEQKKQEIMRRYGIDPTKNWQINAETKKIMYTKEV